MNDSSHSPATIVEPSRGAANEWDEFVLRAPRSTFFHLCAWGEVLAEVFEFRLRPLVARRDGRIVGVLPLCELGPRRKPRCVMSLPFAVDGGVCALDMEARDALEHAAVTLTEQCGARYLELRDDVDRPGFQRVARPSSRFRRRIYATDAENLAAMRPNQRRMVRIGQEAGLVARVGDDAVEVFHAMFAHSMRRLGTPVFPLRYFRALQRRFGERCRLLTVWRGTLPVAGVFAFFHHDEVSPYYVASRREYFRYAINDFMYWELMRYARERGCTVFDFGRSRTGSGPYEFKRHWGFTPEAMHYRFYGAVDAQPGEPGGGLSLARSLWQRLPLPVTKVLGPFLIRRIGVYHT